MDSLILALARKWEVLSSFNSTSLKFGEGCLKKERKRDIYCKIKEGWRTWGLN